MQSDCTYTDWGIRLLILWLLILFLKAWLVFPTNRRPQRWHVTKLTTFKVLQDQSPEPITYFSSDTASEHHVRLKSKAIVAVTFANAVRSSMLVGSGIIGGAGTWQIFVFLLSLTNLLSVLPLDLVILKTMLPAIFITISESLFPYIYSHVDGKEIKNLQL